MSDTAALINLTAPDDGDNTWTVEQEEVTIETIIADSDGQTQDISWRFGPISMEGLLDLDTFEMSVKETIAGIAAGPITGNLKDGVKLNVNLQSAKGSTALYLKNGNELWTHLDIKIVWNGSYKGDYKIFSF
ncbi:hypothetical protein SCAR479_09169 [Seiridium cardinale]|uniref:Uncharacterized protein n=1 Tax=Seiridium cardinale TaxID=138064 RepID=A0ABR2XK85_9PEZI